MNTKEHGSRHDDPKLSHGKSTQERKRHSTSVQLPHMHYPSQPKTLQLGLKYWLHNQHRSPQLHTHHNLSQARAVSVLASKTAEKTCENTQKGNPLAAVQCVPAAACWQQAPFACINIPPLCTLPLRRQAQPHQRCPDPHSPLCR